MARDWCGELEDFLRERHKALPLSKNEDYRRPFRSIVPGLGEEEAEDFLRGMAEGLFRVENDGYVSSPLLPPRLPRANRQKTIQMFWHHGKERLLFREGVCQLAAASALVLKYGWPIEQVRLEPYQEDVGDVAYGVDLLVWESVGGPVLICGEVKSTAAEYRKLLRAVRECGRRGPHEKSDCEKKHQQNHPKFEICWNLRPRYFWAVCPGTRQAFPLEYGDRALVLKDITDLPHNDEQAISSA